jgi:hypothetical protein
VSAIHQLRASTWTEDAARRWRSLDVAEAANAVVSDLIGFGEMLPLACFAEARVFPVVEWHSKSLSVRLEEAAEPLLDPALVRDVLEDDGWAKNYPAVLSIIGFIGVAPLAEARRELAGLRSMGRTIAMTPHGRAMSTLTLAEFDLQGTAVVSLDDELRILTGGDPGIRRGAQMSSVWMRFYEEQLFDWALTTQSLPSLTR